MKVYKFGGASVRNADGVRNLHKIVGDERNLFIVVSAMGKTTNALEKVFEGLQRGDRAASAERIAERIRTFPTMPADGIPYWDFDAPNIPDEPRDVSAAAVLASALYDLASLTGERGSAHKAWADRILENLTASYRAPRGTHHGFLLLHSVGNLPSGSEVDTPLNYADYYFLEALLRKQACERADK